MTGLPWKSVHRSVLSFCSANQVVVVVFFPLKTNPYPKKGSSHRISFEVVRPIFWGGLAHDTLILLWSEPQILSSNKKWLPSPRVLRPFLQTLGVILNVYLYAFLTKERRNHFLFIFIFMVSVTFLLNPWLKEHFFYVCIYNGHLVLWLWARYLY